jgi:hypothetical protein
MHMIPVVSSNVTAVGYDDDRKVLRLRFHNGTVYEYSGVPATVYRALLDAPSKGSFINDRFKNGPYPLGLQEVLPSRTRSGWLRGRRKLF